MKLFNDEKKGTVEYKNRTESYFKGKGEFDNKQFNWFLFQDGKVEINTLGDVEFEKHTLKEIERIIIISKIKELYANGEATQALELFEERFSMISINEFEILMNFNNTTNVNELEKLVQY